MTKKNERVLGPGADGDPDNVGPVSAEPQPGEPLQPEDVAPTKEKE